MDTATPRLFRHKTTRPTGVSETGRTVHLPDDLVSEQLKRLAVFAGVGVGLWTFSLVMNTLIIPATLTGAPMAPRAALMLELIAVAASIAMVAYVRYVRQPPATKVAFGGAYMLVNAAAIAALNNWFEPIDTSQVMHLSWVTIVVLLFSITMPVRPRTSLILSLTAASFDPLAVWVVHLTGFPTPGPVQTFVLYLPNYVMAFAATVPAHVFQHVGRQLREAEELGSYRLVERLGEGGMGEVWRAEHRLLARGAAVKIVRPEVLGAATQADARTILRRFEREARATASLNSPHTIQIFDFGLSEAGTFYYVMELLTGLDLETLIRSHGPLPADRVIFLLRQACHSLADAHARGLVHRDVKPANIYVCRMGRDYDFVKVLDFGLVKMNRPNAAGATLLTADQRPTGTPAYMAPELVLGDRDVDRRADVYALGCVAYFLLTGQLVFDADTPMKMMLEHLNTTPVPPSARSELPIPPEIDALVLSCLEKDPSRRPQDAESLFKLACGCRICETWNHDRARGWWQTHLPELTVPLTIDDTAAPELDTMAYS
ncbi:MAG TPA: serine/threonine-protein kinase [Vicinamibacterales bacterium]|jgi:serine/threonine-protein kinase